MLLCILPAGIVHVLYYDRIISIIIYNTSSYHFWYDRSSSLLVHLRSSRPTYQQVDLGVTNMKT